MSHHTSPVEAAGVFTRVKPRLAVYIHLALLATDSVIAPPTIADIVTATRANYRGRFEVGEDLMTVAVADSVTVRRPPHTR